jgi:glycosyltransferase involved in cell wall biosynthesis
MARVLALQPYHGGSHEAFMDGLVSRSRHEIVVLSQPASFYKWRMRGSAITLAARARASGVEPDAILCTDMLSLAEFLPLYGRAVPAILYMHENQLAYPVGRPDPRDLHFAFTNITSCLAAARVLWNSRYNMESFLEAVPRLFAMMPDQRPEGVDEEIRARSTVVHPGVDLAALDEVPLERDGGPPIVVWNHRWEHDKRPDDFFAALLAAMERGADMRVAVLGESFEEQPAVFDEARARLGGRVVQFGYAYSHDEYLRWLRRSSVSISTAAQENFGISAVEAAYAGAHPLWPDRLSYPELIGPEGGRDHLYRDPPELVDRLCELVDLSARGREDPDRYRPLLARYDWSRVIDVYDDLIEDAVRGGL